jgi:transcriptional regulator with XRE-family HTH domain
VSESTRFDESRQALADRVRALRAERGLSQEALAHEAGIDRTYASQIERAVGNPSLKVLCAIATALNVELNDLLRA